MKLSVKKLYHKTISGLIQFFAKNIGTKWFYAVHKTNSAQKDVDQIIVPLLKKGQSFLTKTKGAASEFMIPGDWSHFLIYIGLVPIKINGSIQMIHCVHEATTEEGYVMHYLSDVICRTDNWALTELIDMTPLEGDKIVQKSTTMLGREYDFGMDIDETSDDEDESNKKIFCSESGYKAINFARPGTLDLRDTFGYLTFTPQDCYNAKSKFKVLAQKIDNVVTVF